MPSLVFVGLVAYSPLVNYVFWSPKAALVPLVVALGLPLVVRDAVAGDITARMGLSFGVIGLLSAALSSNRTVAFFGLYGWGTGALFVLAIPAAWALGRSATSSQLRPRIEIAALMGVAVNAAVVLLQASFDLEWARLGLIDGRPTGLMGSPVSLSALLAGGAGLVAARFRGRPIDLLWPITLGAALQLCGSRAALAAGVVVSVVALRKRPRLAGAFFALAGIGLLLSVPLSRIQDVSTGTDRIQGESTAGAAARLRNWEIGVDAFGDRPVLGSGPGTYALATSALRTPELAKAEGPDRIFADAHNLVVEYAVTTGALGLLALAAFGVLLLKDARDRPLLWFGIGLLAVHAVEPQHVTLTPFAFLAIGAASRRQRSPSPPWWARAVAVIPALVLGVLLLVGDYQLHQSDLDFTQDQAATALRILPRWKEPASLQARNVLYEAIVTRSGAKFEESREWRAEAARREPTDPSVWGKLADMDMRMGDPEAAVTNFERGLRANPVSVSIRLGLIEALTALGRNAEAAAVVLEAQALAPNPEQVETLDAYARALAETAS
ncbi:MAG: O-antigen ligase family protein [Acidimicrobiales bacterium]